MAWWTEKDALKEQIRLLKKELKVQEMGGYQPDGHTKLDPSNPPKGGSGVSNNVNLAHISIVMRSLQEKKMAWIGKQKIYIRDEKALKETAKDYQTRRLFLIELINLSETAINDLEDIINQNLT